MTSMHNVKREVDATANTRWLWARWLALVMVLLVMLSSVPTSGDEAAEAKGNIAESILPDKITPKKEDVERTIMGLRNKAIELRQHPNRHEEMLGAVLTALKLSKEYFGDESVNYAQVLGDAGDAYAVRKEFEKAAPLLRESLDVYQKVQGVNSAIWGIAAGKLADAYSALRKHQEAVKYYKKQLELMKKGLGDRHMACFLVMRNIGKEYREMQKFKSAVKVYKKIIATYDEGKGPDIETADFIPGFEAAKEHRDTEFLAQTYEGLGHSYIGLKNQEEAIKAWEEGLKLYKAAKVARSMTYAFFINQLASEYTQIGEHSRAVPLLSEAYDIAMKTYGEEHELVKQAKVTLGYVQALDKSNAGPRPRTNPRISFGDDGKPVVGFENGEQADVKIMKTPTGESDDAKHEEL